MEASILRGRGGKAEVPFINPHTYVSGRPVRAFIRAPAFMIRHCNLNPPKENVTPLKDIDNSSAWEVRGRNESLHAADV